MNRPPEILVNSGCVTDQNGVLTAMIIPNNVVMQNTPSIVTTYATTISWIPSDSATLEELNCINATTLNTNFQSWTKLARVYFGEMSVFTAETFKNCSGLTTVSMPKFSHNTTYLFNACTGLRSVVLGSPGHPVVSLQWATFNGVTTNELVITLYTTNGAALTGEPWGATGAAIEYEEA